MKSSWQEYEIADPEKFDFELANYGKEDSEEQNIYMTVPKGKKDLPLVIFFHGGGMTFSARECPGRLFNGEYAVAEPRYRLSPGTQAPGQIEDAAMAVAWCFENAEKYRIDRKKIFVGGMSAGAYLAAIAVMNPEFLKKYSLSFRDIAGMPLISGQMTTHFRIKADLGKDNGAHNPLLDEYAPMSFASAELPPILMVTGDSASDMPARMEENAYFAAILRASGHPMVHHYALPGHDHGGAFTACGFLLLKFLNTVLSAK